MVTDRLFDAEQDFNLLELSLSNDEHHKGTTPEFFLESGTMTKTYEDEQGSVLFVRGAPVLRLDVQFVNNEDSRRNLRTMLAGFPKLVDKAYENGFKEIVFNTSVPLLRQFCVKRLGFSLVEGDELRKIL